MQRELLNDIKARLDAAPGDWRVSSAATPGSDRVVVDGRGCVVAVASGPEDAAAIAQGHADGLALLAEVDRLTKGLAEERAPHRETFESARELIVSDEPPSEEAMRYGREVVAPKLGKVLP